MVTELCDRFIDTLLRRQAYMRLAIDHARYGLDGNTGKVGYVKYSGFWHG